MHTPAPPATIPPDPAGPDWATLREDIRCPLCDYDLRGLAEPRCPECGYAFQWDELLDSAKRLHPYLFEHHPRRNLWSFRRTLLGTLNARQFWARFRPTQPGSVRRLVLYWLIGALPLLAALAVWNAHRLVEYDREVKSQRAMTQVILRLDPDWLTNSTPQFRSAAEYDEAINPLPPRWAFFNKAFREQEPRPFDKWLIAWLAWPWLTFLALMVFGFSMRRARVRPVHVLRCVLYSFDAVFWLGLVTIAVLAQQWWARQMVAGIGQLSTDEQMLFQRFFVANEATTVICVGGLALVPFMAWRLTTACRTYLRFDRPAATVLASQLIVLLVVLIWIANWRGLGRLVY